MPEPIHCLVFSRRRPLQLHALLESIGRHAPYRSVTVLARVDDGWREPYRICERAFPLVEFVEERDFERQTLDWLSGRGRVCFHSDDELWFRPPPPALLELDPSETIVTFRQGRNTTYCHPLQRGQYVPERFPWRWREADLDFAYPLSVNATVYQAADLWPLLDFHFTNPTTLEARLAANAARLQVEWMTAPEHSCTVSLPHNVTSESSGNPRGANPAWQPEPLRDYYLLGWRLDLDGIDYAAVNAAHVELPLEFRRIV